MTWKKVLSWIAMLGLLISASGCATAISKGLRDQADRNINYGEVLKNPDTYRGVLVIWGGDILSTKNLKEGTLLEILQKPTDFEDRPKDVDQSAGRFLAMYQGYLDEAIYAKGREVTVAGKIQGRKVMPLGEITYTYPLIEAAEIYLWPKRSEERYYYPPYWYDPWWYYPYWRYW